MSNDNYRNFMGYLWYQKEDNVYTIGVNESGLEDFSEIENMDLPAEGESVEEDVVCGTIDTDQGPLDIYSPVSGTIVEINTAVTEDPELIQEDPYEGWLLKIEATDDADDEDEDEEDDDDEDDEDEDEDYEDEE
ncbi:MAG: glycine cleavage system protein H [Proteobacteria bacterium]|nr:glycine cleavage system protein H [Pseudomonadota bacterium]